MFIGAYDNAHEFYSFVCKDDSIYIYKGNEEFGKNKILSITAYSIRNLKKAGQFE